MKQKITIVVEVEDVPAVDFASMRLNMESFCRRKAEEISETHYVESFQVPSQHETNVLSALAYLRRALDPQYVGWEDQYKAILWSMGIDPDGPTTAFLDK